MQEPHLTFVLHNGFFRIRTRFLKPMLNHDHADTERTLQAAS
jgi:hypothetical protein